MTLRKSPHRIHRDARYFETRHAAMDRRVRKLEAALRKIESLGYGPAMAVARIALGSPAGKD